VHHLAHILDDIVLVPEPLPSGTWVISSVTGWPVIDGTLVEVFGIVLKENKHFFTQIYHES